mmetsp:Transcript_89329/g.251481  ORF Transcript_89329/g.251481 Transcript_89329/m.251481 type:complete len:227 (-) Transcript_89329:534-1214(-)
MRTRRSVTAAHRRRNRKPTGKRGSSIISCSPALPDGEVTMASRPTGASRKNIAKRLTNSGSTAVTPKTTPVLKAARREPDKYAVAREPPDCASQQADCKFPASSRSPRCSALRVRSTTMESATTSANATAREAAVAPAMTTAGTIPLKANQVQAAEPTNPARTRYDFLWLPNIGTASLMKPYKGLTTQGMLMRPMSAATSAGGKPNSSFKRNVTAKRASPNAPWTK